MYRDVGHGSLDRIQDIAVWGVRQGSTLACSHRCPKGLRLIVHLRPFGDDLVASIGIDHHVHACRIESLQLSQRLLTPSASQYDYTHTGQDPECFHRGRQGKQNDESATSHFL